LFGRCLQGTSLNTHFFDFSFEASYRVVWMWRSGVADCGAGRVVVLMVHSG